MSSSKREAGVENPASTPDVASACAAFLSLPNPKDAAGFSNLASLRVTNSLECEAVLTAIIDACTAHPRNRVAAGPTVVRRVCALMADGLVIGERATHSWCGAVVALYSHRTDPTIPDANLAALDAAGGTSMLAHVRLRFPNFQKICILIVNAFELLAARPASLLNALRCGSLNHTYAVMRTFQDSERVQIVCCTAIMNHIYALSDTSISADACRAIYGCRMSGDVRDGIVRSGGLARIYAAMEAHPTSAAVQDIACRTLCRLAVGSNSLRILASGGMARFSVALSLASTDVLAVACDALINLLQDLNSRDVIIPFGGLTAVFALMEAHPTSTAVLVLACKVLQTISVDHPSNQVAAVTSGALDRVYAAMLAHPVAADVQEATCGVLCNLSGVTDEINMKIISSGGLKLVYAALSAHSCSAKVVTAAFLALRGIVLNQDRAQTTLIVERHGVLGNVYPSMRDNLSSVLVQESALGLLRNVATSIENVEAISSTGGLTLMYAAMRRHPRSAAVQEAAIGTMVNMSNVPAVASKMKADRVAELTRAALKNYSNPATAHGAVYERLAAQGALLLARLRY